MITRNSHCIYCKQELFKEPDIIQYNVGGTYVNFHIMRFQCEKRCLMHGFLDGESVFKMNNLKRLIVDGMEKWK